MNASVENWDNIRMFVTAARCGSAREAARRLGVNQSTLSRRLTQLETDRGVRLLDRTARGMTLTDAGHEVFEAAKEIEQRFTELDRTILGRDDRLAGRLRVSLPDFAVSLLGPLLAKFSRKHPQVQLDIRVESDVADLGGAGADVVLRYASRPPEHLVGRRLGRPQVGVYGSRRYLRGRDPTDLASLHWVRWGRAWRDVRAEKWIERNVPPQNVVAEVNNNFVAAELLAAGLGVGFQPCFCADADRRLKRLDAEFDFSIDLWLLTHEDLRRTARVAAFIKFVADGVASQRDKL